MPKYVNTLKSRRNRRHFADAIFKCIFSNKNAWISFKKLRKFVPQSAIHNIPSLALIMAWRRPGDKPLLEPIMGRTLTHECDLNELTQWLTLWRSWLSVCTAQSHYLNQRWLILCNALRNEPSYSWNKKDRLSFELYFWKWRLEN